MKFKKWYMKKKTKKILEVIAYIVGTIAIIIAVVGILKIYFVDSPAMARAEKYCNSLGYDFMKPIIIGHTKTVYLCCREVNNKIVCEEK